MEGEVSEMSDDKKALKFLSLKQMYEDADKILREYAEAHGFTGTDVERLLRLCRGQVEKNPLIGDYNGWLVHIMSFDETCNPDALQGEINQQFSEYCDRAQTDWDSARGMWQYDRSLPAETSPQGEMNVLGRKSQRYHTGKHGPKFGGGDDGKQGSS